MNKEIMKDVAEELNEFYEYIKELEMEEAIKSLKDSIQEKEIVLNILKNILTQIEG